jgi:hypothetical protein
MNILPEGWCNCTYSVGGMTQMHLFYLFYQRYDGIVHILSEGYGSCLGWMT